MSQPHPAWNQGCGGGRVVVGLQCMEATGPGMAYSLTGSKHVGGVGRVN